MKKNVYKYLIFKKNALRHIMYIWALGNPGYIFYINNLKNCTICCVNKS